LRRYDDSSVYEIVEIPAEAPEDPESVGSKFKFWFSGGQRLFKGVRGTSGEDWAEKISAELAGLIGLPHANYELASWQQSPAHISGVVSANFCGKGEALVLGNELLAQVVPDYALGVSKFHESAHTLGRVLQTLNERQPSLPLRWEPPGNITSAAELFIGYLLLDALVGNTDRHHENWGVVRTSSGNEHLAPTFDHASSLGCHEVDERRSARLCTRDKNFAVAAFARKGRSALYLNAEDARPLLLRDAFLLAAQQFTSAGKYWLGVLGGISDAGLGILVNEVPPARMTRLAAEFATQLLVINRDALLALAGEL
jgi:hypothetical protein